MGHCWGRSAMASPQLWGSGVHALPVLQLLLLLLLPLRVTPAVSICFIYTQYSVFQEQEHSRCVEGPGRIYSNVSHQEKGVLCRMRYLCDRKGTTCPTPIMIEHADIQVKNYSVNARERYVCNSGFKRKAGTSTLTECVINKNTNVAHWTTPNLKCIRDPSVAQNPVPTVGTPKVTSQPESPSPSEKEPEAFSPKSDTTVAIETAIMTGSRLTPSPPTSAGTGSHTSSQAPSLAAATWEPTASTSLGITEISPHSSKMTKVAISSSVLLVGAGVVVAFLAWYIKSRQTSQPCHVVVETMETVPMTVRASSTGGEDPGA